MYAWNKNFTDQNTLIVMKSQCVLACKFVIFVLVMHDLNHFKANVVPFPKCTITFIKSKYFRSYRQLNNNKNWSDLQQFRNISFKKYPVQLSAGQRRVEGAIPPFRFCFARAFLYELFFSFQTLCLYILCKSLLKYHSIKDYL